MPREQPATQRASRSGENAAYYARRLRLHRMLAARGPMSAADLATAIEWELREVTAKLQDLRRSGMADRDEQRSKRRLWWAT